jgi:hypothetical protein
LVVGHENELKNLLIQAIDGTLDNILNINAVNDTIGNSYQYHYLNVSPDFTFSVMQKEKIRLDPSLSFKPDEFPMGVRYPDDYILKECNDISKIIVILGALNNIKIRTVYN